MEKMRVLKVIMVPVVIIMALLFCRCEDNPALPESMTAAASILIDKDGGVVRGMNDNVIITIPEGALDIPVRFVIHGLLGRSTGADYALKELVIEPTVVFKKPVQVSLRYDGCLGNGISVCNAESVLFAIWDDEVTFAQGSAPKVCSCCTVDQASNSLCMKICQTGVLATIAEW
jgi:hypothetical protein